MFGLFQNQPLLDAGARQWLIDAYSWALANFGSDIFYDDTELIAPTDQFFPDKVDSPQDMVLRLFERVRQYGGMQAWPCELIASGPDDEPKNTPTFVVNQAPRGDSSSITINAEMGYLPVSYDPAHLKTPEVLITLFSAELGNYLGMAAKEPPPGGEDFRKHAADLLAVFMGFGLFWANNAVNISRGGCSGCGVSVQCFGAMSEDEFTYALAIFSVLKNIPVSDVEVNLKKTRHSFFRKAIKEIESSTDELSRLKSIQYPINSIT